MSTKWTAAALVTGLVTSLLVVAPAAPASATSICVGVYKLTWSNVTEPWAITHRKIIENYTGGKVTKTYSVERIYTVGASVTATAGGKVSASVAIASLEEHVDLELQVSGSYTNKKAESITYTLDKDDTYIIYSGTRKVTGKYTRWECVSGGGWKKTGQHGNAVSWTDEREGGVRCGATVPKKSLAAAVKKKYC